MRNAVSLFVTVSLLCSQVALAADANQHVQGLLLRAAITESQVDPRLSIAQELDGTGSIEVNNVLNETTLTLNRAFNCPAGLICAQVMPEPEVITLPIVRRTTNKCGARITIALHDARPADGWLQLIEVRDNRANHCPELMHAPPRPQTEIKYVTVSARMAGDSADDARTVSKFAASRLVDLTMGR